MGAEVSNPPPLPNPGAAPSVGRVKGCFLTWLAAADSMELIAWSEITSGEAVGSSESAAWFFLANACYPPQVSATLLPAFGWAVREHPVSVWQNTGWSREVICGRLSPCALLGWSGGIKSLVWETILFLGRQVLAHLSQRHVQQSTCSFSPIERGLVPWKVPALLCLLIAC